MTSRPEASPAEDVVLCVGAKTTTVWQSVLGRGDLRSLLIKTPEDPGWHKATPISDPAWAFAARSLRAAVAELAQAPFRRLHVFATGPYSLGALLACELQHHFGRDRAIHIYQFDDRSKAWVDWGLLGQPLSQGEPLLRVTLPQEPTATQVVVAIKSRQVIERAELAPALLGLSPALWLDVEAPEHLSGPAQAAQLAAELDALLRTTLPTAYPAAELHVCYSGPLAAFMLGTAKLHLAARPLTIYDRISAGAGWRYWPALKLPQRRLGFGDGVIFVAVVDEWFSRKGGISTFNRELCRGLGRLGYRVLCLVTEPFANEEEDDAALSGVKLLRRPPEDAPDVLLGHDHISGAQALELKRTRYPRSRAVLLIHTGPDEIEWHKDAADEKLSASAATKAEAQAKVASGADLVFGVGPVLTDQIHDALRRRKLRNTHVHELLPWLLPVESADASPPRRAQCLLVGRPEHVRLKGIDLAVRALERLGDPPPLYLRGASHGTTAALREKLQSRLGANLRVQLFDPDEARNSDAFRGATVVLMPSRSEGFGLVGLEAISYCVPVLVSAKSGLGEVLLKLATEAARAAVVPVSLEDEDAIAAWKNAVEVKLRAPEPAFAQAQRLYQDLKDTLAADKILPAFVSRCLDAQVG